MGNFWSSRHTGYLIKRLVVVIAFLVFYFMVFPPLKEEIQQYVAPFVTEEEEPAEEIVPPEEIIPPIKVPGGVPLKAKSEPARKPAAVPEHRIEKAPRFKFGKKVKPEEIYGSSGAGRRILDVFISKNEEKKIIKKSFSDTSIPAPKGKEAPEIDAYSWRDELYNFNTPGKKEPVENVVLLVLDIKEARKEVVSITKEENGEIAGYKNEIVSLYIPVEKYPVFLEALEERVGEFVRPARGAFVEVELEKRKGMVSLGVELKLPPDR